MEEQKLILSFLLITCFSCMIVNAQNRKATNPGIPAVFAFGDSTLDPGNNNYIPLTIVKANHLPYGRDLPSYAASGRFCNGKLLTDFIVSSLGLKDVLPAYLDPTLTDQDFVTGVSFASAGAGLDDLTATVTNVEQISTQLNQFQQALDRIQRAVGSQRARQIMEKALFVVGAVSNDMLWNFYGLKTRRAQFTVSSYHDFLLKKLESFVQQLYGMGARKMTIAGLGPMGCLPIQMTLASPIPGMMRGCVKEQNLDAQAYNVKLQALISRLQSTLPGSKILYLDSYAPTMDMIQNPTRYGFQETTRGCCGTGMIEMAEMCNQFVPTCPDASKFLFWDAVHPTHSTYQIFASLFEKNLLPQLH